MRTRYTIREPDAPHFLTCTVVQWIPLFTRKPYFDILLDALRFCRQHKGLKIYAYVILDNQSAPGGVRAEAGGHHPGFQELHRQTPPRPVQQNGRKPRNPGETPSLEGRGFGGGWQNFNPPD